MNIAVVRQHYFVTLMTLGVLVALALLPTVIRYADPELEARITHHCFDKHISLRVCVEKYYENDAKEYGVSHAILKLKDDLPKNTVISANCHETMHLLGRVAYKEYGSLGEAFAHGDYTCWSGYFHGAVEGALRGLHLKDVSKETLRELCTGTDISEHSFEQFNCTHGMGHALMYLSNNDVPAALSRCDDLADTWKEGHCATGVFMENSLADDDHPSKFLPTEDLRFPCTIVPQKYLEACYLVQSTFVIQKMNGDFARAFSFCKTLPDESYRTQCARGLGKEVAQRTFYGAKETARICSDKAQELTRECLFGALQDFIGNTHNTSAGKPICDALTDTETQTSCMRMLKDIPISQATTQEK